MELQRNMKIQWNALVHRGMYGSKKGTWKYRGLHGSKWGNESIGLYMGVQYKEYKETLEYRGIHWTTPGA